MRSTLLTFLSGILLTGALSFTAQATTTAPVDVVPDAVEFAALKAIYDNLGGSGWTTKINWPVSGSWPSSATSAQFGTWYGVTVANGDITKIILNGNKLTGTIPVEIGSLQALSTLYMYNNPGITGSIPASIGQMTALQFLSLYGCNLTGTIPSSLFDIAGLQYVSLAINKLSGSIPSNVGNATALTYLSFYDNALTGTIPSSICNLVNLTGLYLYENALTGSIPSNIGNLSKLVNLWLYTNKLTGDIPNSLWNITTLVDLKLSTNQLTGIIPSSVKNLINLQTLTLHTNKLNGSIPSEIGSLSKLQYLYLYSNNFNGELPPELGNLKNLFYFYVYNNKLSGTLPNSFGSMAKLRYFHIYNNQFTGAIPASFSSLKDIISFYIYNNKLNGTLPANLFSGWLKMTHLDVSNNQFSGEFPSSVSECTSLAAMSLHKNQFTSLPTGVLSLNVLTRINLSYNEFTSLPDLTTQQNKANLTLDISRNRLDFGALQPLLTGGIKTTTLTPQKNIQDILFVTPTVGATLTILGRAAGSNGTIVWEKQKGGGNWESVNAQNENSTPQNYTRNAFAVSDEAIYRIRMTNTSFAGVTIMSEPIKVKTAINLAIDNWGFQYKYDGRRRMTHKKVPGADWVYMVYDERDRLVMTQDGEQRKSNKWMVTKYDALNRPIMTGIYTHATAVDQAGMASQISTTAFYDTYNGTTTFHGYTNTVFPFDLTKFDALTVTYYDSYDFKGLLNDDRYNYKSDELDEQYKSDAAGNSFPGVIGQVTCIKTKVLDYYGTGGVTTWLTSVNYYDDKYRVVQTVADNFQGGKDRITNIYDFTGKVMKSRTSRYGISWTSVVGAQRNGNRLDKISTTNGWGTSSGVSVEKLPANKDGWVEFTAAATNKAIIVGLSTLSGTIYQLYLTSGGQFQINEGGSSNLLVPSPTYSAGHVFRVERKSGKIKFYRNNLLLLERPATSSELSAVFNIYNTAGVIYNIRSSFGSYSPQSVTRTFDYDHAGRLKKVWHQVNDGDRILLAQNDYNELGQIITKKLHSEDQGSTFKQHVDMRYNIRGWLTRINNTDLAADASGDPRDHFGMNLVYNEPVSTLNNAPQYNGNISAMTWSNSQGYDDVKANAYKYSYDAMNRISGADFRQKQSSAWDLPQHKDANDNTLTSDAFSETGYDYDLNGNLQHLTRKSTKGTSMDVLTYDYGTGAAKSNKLLSVSDGGDIRQGFTDGNIGSEDYTYDANGSMNADKNKDITAITYNHLNLPVQVTKVSGEYIKYFYDATGRKLCQQVFNSSSAPTKQTDYAGEYFYENDTLKFINHEEGRIVMTGTSPEYQYHLKDHLGNVRVTFTTKIEVDSPVATMETANEEVEGKEFLYYDEAVKVDFELFDHTNQGLTYYSTRLNGTANERTGLAKSLSVMPGDVIKAEVYAKYLDTNASNWSAAVTNLITSIANGTAAATTYVDGGAIGSTGGTVNPFASILDKGNETGTAPKAYLNYLVFDRDYNVLDAGFVRVSEDAKESGTDVQHELLSKELVIKKPGYVYLYLSNDNVALGGSPVEVYFDDFMVEHTKSPVIQTEDYYPFGLAFNSYSRENSVLNKRKFGGKEEQTDLALNTIDWGWRQYDPAIGRWSVIDQWSEKYHTTSPYTFVMDNPVNRREIDGRYFVGKDGKEVEMSTRKNGTIKVGKNATRDLKQLVRLINSSGSKTAIGQVMKVGQNESRINVKIDKKVQDNGLLGVHQAHDKDGNILKWDNKKNDFNGTPAYVEGKEGVYKEATITIFAGNIKKDFKETGGSNGEYYGFKTITEAQEVANTFQHETNHNTDKAFIQDLKNRREGKPNSGMDSHDNVHPQEQKVYQEMESYNNGN
jgi:RHS repeat-associated protein